jgi:hypothetical protein
MNEPVLIYWLVKPAAHLKRWVYSISAITIGRRMPKYSEENLSNVHCKSEMDCATSSHIGAIIRPKKLKILVSHLQYHSWKVDLWKGDILFLITITHQEQSKPKGHLRKVKIETYLKMLNKVYICNTCIKITKLFPHCEQVLICYITLPLE